MKTRSIISAFIVLAIVLFSIEANACPLCQGGAAKDTAFAYKGITLFLALLPILGAGGIFYWIKIKSNKIKDN